MIDYVLVECKCGNCYFKNEISNISEMKCNDCSKISGNMYKLLKSGICTVKIKN